jgi:hypothetical protein
LPKPIPVCQNPGQVSLILKAAGAAKTKYLCLWADGKIFLAIFSKIWVHPQDETKNGPRWNSLLQWGPMLLTMELKTDFTYTGSEK